MESVKIVVRFADGRLLKGYSQDFYPNKPVFHLVKNLAKGSANHKRISVSDLKSIFLLRLLKGILSYQAAEVQPNGSIRPGDFDFLANGNVVITGQDRQADDRVLTGQTTGELVVYEKAEKV